MCLKNAFDRPSVTALFDPCVILTMTTLSTGNQGDGPKGAASNTIVAGKQRI